MTALRNINKLTNDVVKIYFYFYKFYRKFLKKKIVRSTPFITVTVVVIHHTIVLEYICNIVI